MISEIGRNKVQDWGRRRRSFSIFQCSENDAAEIAGALSDGIPELITVHLSDLPDLPETSGPILLYNITSEEAYKNANALHRLVLRLIRWEDQPLFLLSPNHSEEWEKGNLWLGDGEIDSRGLRLDALTLILKQDSVIIPRTSILDLASDQPEMTYIEQQMAKALGAQWISFKAQALIGRYHVDFLLEKNGAQVVVECDGKAYHSSDEARETDRERDSYLQERGYPVLRFTGGEINGRISWCVEQIQRALDKSQEDKSQGFRMDDNLDDSQQKAVFTNPGQVCVLAPAGSGKTKVLTNRGIHLLSEGFREHRVLAMAFNKKAREDMQARLREMGFSGVDLQVHTFNSYGAQLLDGRYSLKGSGFTPNEHEQYSRKLFAVLEKHCGELRKIRRSGRSLRDAIERTKRELTYPGQFLEPACKEVIKGKRPEKSAPVWSTLFEDFLQWQEENDHLTFADQVYLAVRELAEDQDLRRQTQMSIDALLIDEFQDLDAAQLMLVEILALGHSNLFVVGDDDQMIYGWRGADIGRLRSFLKDPNTRKIVLSTNYRSSQLVVRHAGYLISHNEDREAKNVHPKVGAFRGKVELFIGDDIGQECSFLLQALNGARAEGLQWKELAVLVRYTDLYHAVLDALNRASIPVDPKDNATLYSTRAARAVVGYFMGVLDWPSPPGSVLRDILNVPNRFLSYKYVDQISRHANPIAILRAGKDLNDSQREKVLSLLKKLEEANDALKPDSSSAHDLFQSIDVIFRLTTYFKKESGASDDNDAADYGLVIDQLREKAKQFSDPRQFLAYCIDEREKEEKEPVSAGKSTDHGSNSKDVVELTTIHKAKGKEWRGVVLFHQEWRKPYSFEKLSSDDKKSLEEEERRVLYVGATRAREALWVTAERGKKSRFVDELFTNPQFNDVDVSQQLGYRKDRLEKIEQQISSLQEERNQEQIAVDRAQGIDRDSVRKELDARKQSMGFFKRLLFSIGIGGSRVRQLKKDFEIAERAARAGQRIQEIDGRIVTIEDTKRTILEEMDRLEREEKFRQILSDPIGEDTEDQGPPF